MAPHQMITSSNYGPLVEVLVWLMLAFTVVAVCGREAIKVWVLRKVALDDLMISLGLFFVIAQSIAVLIEIRNGLGKHQAALSISQLDRQQQARYAADILLIPSLFFAKATFVMIVYSLSPIRAHRMASLSVGAVIATWALTSIFLVSFRCPPSQAWKETGRGCIDGHIVFDYVLVFNMLTEMALILSPCALLWNLQMQRAKKLSVLLTFLSRFTVVAALICQLVFVHQVGTDRSFDLWRVTVCAQIVQCLTASTTCFVYLRSFLDSAESGFLRVDDARRRGQLSTHASGSLEDSQASSQYKSKKRRQPPPIELFENQTHHTDAQYSPWARSFASNPRSITTTQTFTVEYR